MGKKKKKERDGRALFEEYYRDIYGERWEALKEAFSKEKENVNLSDELVSPYYLDPASRMVAECLPLEGNEKVLDMCAAPGGKTLSIALRLNDTSQLTSNDRSPERRKRLRNVLTECLGEEKGQKVRVTGFDAGSWCLYEQEEYDRILLDAPCSSERHVYNDEKYLSIWSPSRPKRLSGEQYAILSSAFIALRKGGILLYSTCSVNPEENEKVIAKLFRRHPDEVEELETGLEKGERLSHGTVILPDKEDGLGPLYCCLIKKS